MSGPKGSRPITIRASLPTAQDTSASKSIQMGLRDILFRKQRLIEGMVSSYMQAWEECLQHFRAAMEIYLEKGLGEEFERLVEQTHRAESRADDLRRKVEYEMYARALLPESRGDILGFLEAIDAIPGCAQGILFLLSEQCVVLPPVYAADVRKLIVCSLEATSVLGGLARNVFASQPHLLDDVHTIDHKESECDQVERNLIRKIFESEDLNGYQKLLLRDFVLKGGDLSDLAQRVAYRMTIMSLKRRI